MSKGVLDVIRQAIEFVPTNAYPHTRPMADDLREAREAVAELIEAAEEFSAAVEGTPLEYSIAKRFTAALKRAKGE